MGFSGPDFHRAGVVHLISPDAASCSIAAADGAAGADAVESWPTATSGVDDVEDVDDCEGWLGATSFGGEAHAPKSRGVESNNVKM
jgi:hypothetical protein